MTAFAAVSNTFFLQPELAYDDSFVVERHVVCGWREKEGTAVLTPLLPGKPPRPSRHCAILHPNGYVSVPAAELTFGTYESWEAYAAPALRKDLGVESPPEPAPAEADVTDVRDLPPRPAERVEVEAREDRDESRFGEDDRPYGVTADPERSRRTKDEVAEDEAYLAAIEATGKTIRAANSRFKTMNSRRAVLLDLGAITETPPAEEPDEANDPYADDADLLG